MVVLDEAKLVGIMETFPWDEWEARYFEEFEPLRFGVLVAAGKLMGSMLDRLIGKSHPGYERKSFDFEDPSVLLEHTTYVGDRIAQLTDTSKKDVISLIRSTLAGTDGVGVRELGDLVVSAVRTRYAGYEDWRADRIARTETGIAYNHGSIAANRQSGLKTVLVLDGTDADSGCVLANGSLWSNDQAMRNPLEHPNCSRAFAPNMEEIDGL